MTALLEVRGLSKRFGGVRAVTEFALDAEVGSLTGLIGPNGAGKSTFIELVSGHIRPDQGSILFDGCEIQGWPAHRVASLGLLRGFQLAREWPDLTVMENLLVSAVSPDEVAIWRALVHRRKLKQSQKADRERCQEVLEEFGLLDLRDELAGRLSGGQKRLLEFARLALARPKLVILDEPLAGVSPLMASRIQESTRRLVDRGITVLLVEHNLEVVEQLCNSVVVMALGQRIASGTMAELKSNPVVVDAYFGSND
jgi:ABC-type branched-subunit amino acid transport system ATPase component